MNKSKIYTLVGVAALVVTVFVVATQLYKESSAPEPGAVSQEDTLQRLLGDSERTQGPKAARVTLVEFVDPECESCRLMHPITKKVLAEFPGQVHFVLRYMPFHANSAYAASALEAAARQGQYWESLDILFEKQPEWGSHENPRPQLILGYLEELGLDRSRLEADMKDPLIAARIERDKLDGLALGVNGTPSFFINGKMLQGLGEIPLRNAIQQELENTP